jgi:acylphosphatase
MFCKQVIYTGHVQGVGFRYTTRQIASGFEVVGWVKNLPEGTVEMQVMSADEEELDAFLEAVKTSSLRGNIRDLKIRDIPPLKGIKGFSSK